MAKWVCKELFSQEALPAKDLVNVNIVKHSCWVTVMDLQFFLQLPGVLLHWVPCECCVGVCLSPMFFGGEEVVPEQFSGVICCVCSRVCWLMDHPIVHQGL